MARLDYPVHTFSEGSAGGAGGRRFSSNLSPERDSVWTPMLNSRQQCRCADSVSQSLNNEILSKDSMDLFGYGVLLMITDLRQARVSMDEHAKAPGRT